MKLEEYIAKYGEKEGTKRWEKNEHTKHWYQAHHKEQLEYKKRYNKQYRQEHREEVREYYKQWYQVHRKEKAEYDKQRYQTPYGRAQQLISEYRRKDRLNNRGDCTLTAQWIVDNIFTRTCLYCGESDWQLLGCDRIDNSKPHTPNNVVCCCKKCNSKRRDKDFFEYAYSIGAKDAECLVIKYNNEEH